MKFPTFVALASTALSALAVPTSEPAALVQRNGTILEKRGNSIHVCQGINWNNGCVDFNPPWNECLPWSALGLSGLGTWGPSPGVYCLLYNGDCGTHDTPSNSFTYPGLSPVPGYWQYNTHSFKCWW